MSGDWSTDIALALAFIAGMVTQAVIWCALARRSEREKKELQRRTRLDDCIDSIELKLHTLEKKVEFLMPMTEEEKNHARMEPAQPRHHSTRQGRQHPVDAVP